MCHLRAGENLERELLGKLPESELRALLTATHRPNFTNQVSGVVCVGGSRRGAVVCGGVVCVGGPGVRPRGAGCKDRCRGCCVCVRAH